MRHRTLVNALPANLSGALAATARATEPACRGPFYLHRTRPWIWRGLMGLALLLAVTALAAVAWRAQHGPLDGAAWAMASFALPFVLLLLRPSAWHSPVSMVADARGMHFLHGRGGRSCHSVAWRDVGAMRIERVALGGGVTRTVVVRIRGDSPFWSETEASPFMQRWIQPVDRDGWRSLPLPPVWTSMQAALATLEQLRHSDRT